jgi:Flp pilus assembly protein TadD
LQRRWKEALDALSMAHQMDPANPQWRTKMYEAEAEIAPEITKKKLAEMLKKSPGDTDLTCVYASLICESGTNQERAELLRGLEAWKGENPSILFWRGALANALGQVEKAEGCWREVVRLTPHMASPYNELAKSATKRKAPFSEITSLCLKAAELDPSNASFHNNLGYAYFMEGQHANAIRELDRAIVLDPSFGLAYYNLGLVRYSAGEYQEAWSAILKAREHGYPGDSSFVMKVEARVRVMEPNTTNAPAYGPAKQSPKRGEEGNVIMRIRPQTN